MINDETIQRLIAWADSKPQIRALVLTSTRARPDAALDPFSDYDVILAVDDVRPFFEDRAWLSHFGSVLAVYRDPLHDLCGHERFAYITQYAHDRLKIDFTVIPAALLRDLTPDCALHDELDMGYHVLLDKDHLTAGLPQPTFSAFLPQSPDEATYHELVEVFFHEATYVAKNIWRDELLPAKYSFDHVMKQNLLRQMLEWRIGAVYGWSVITGVLGKGLKRHTPPELWAQLESTYVGTEIEENWDALFRLIHLFRQVAVEVGQNLAYSYPDDLHERNCAYLLEVRAMPRQNSR